MAGPERIEYAVGLGYRRDDDHDDYDWLVRLPEGEPAKHEFMAHLLLLAARLEWRHADQLREAQRDSERRRARAAKRKARK